MSQHRFLATPFDASLPIPGIGRHDGTPRPSLAITFAEVDAMLAEYNGSFASTVVTALSEMGQACAPAARSLEDGYRVLYEQLGAGR